MDVSIHKLPYICYSFTRAYILQLKTIHQRGLVWLLPLASMDGVALVLKTFAFGSCRNISVLSGLRLSSVATSSDRMRVSRPSFRTSWQFPLDLLITFVTCLFHLWLAYFIRGLPTG